MSANAVAIRSPLKRKRITPLPYILLIPTMFFLIVFTFYPLVNCIRLTFYATDQIADLIRDCLVVDTKKSN